VLLSLTGRLVRATKLTCLLTNLDYFVLRQQTLELNIVEGAGCHHNARNGGCCTGVRHIEDHQHAGPLATVLYMEISLPPALSIMLFAAS
jgi:hypothetical protein